MRNRYNKATDLHRPALDCQPSEHVYIDHSHLWWAAEACASLWAAMRFTKLGGAAGANFQTRPGALTPAPQTSSTDHSGHFQTVCINKPHHSQHCDVVQHPWASWPGCLPCVVRWKFRQKVVGNQQQGDLHRHALDYQPSEHVYIDHLHLWWAAEACASLWMAMRFTKLGGVAGASFQTRPGALTPAPQTHQRITPDTSRQYA